jgi:hypothetical protein
MNENLWVESNSQIPFKFKVQNYFQIFIQNPLRSSPSANNESCSKSHNLSPNFFNIFLTLLYILPSHRIISVFIGKWIKKIWIYLFGPTQLPARAAPPPHRTSTLSRPTCQPTPFLTRPQASGRVPNHFRRATTKALCRWATPPTLLSLSSV